MLAARGVSLGLGSIKLNQMPITDKKALTRSHKRISKEKPKKPCVKRRVDTKTLWTACRAVVGGVALMTIGLLMTVLGYFDQNFKNAPTTLGTTTYSPLVHYQLKSMQYVGPVLMGCGMFMLIIACVVTLESRDRHTQIVEEIPPDSWSGPKKKTNKNMAREENPRLLKTNTTEKCKIEETDDQEHDRRLAAIYPSQTGCLLRAGIADSVGPIILHDGYQNVTGPCLTTRGGTSEFSMPSTSESTAHAEEEAYVKISPSFTAAEINRAFPKRQAPLVKGESLSISLMTSPSSTPRLPLIVSVDDKEAS